MSDLAIDSSNVYWTTTTAVLSTAQAGGGAVATLASGPTNAFPLTVDSSKVYWTEGPASGGTIAACAIGGCGGTPTQLVTTATLSEHRS